MASDLVSFLVDAGRAAPSADNMQPWRFVLEGDSLRLVFDVGRCGHHLFGPASHATLLSMGAVVENLAQALDAAGGVADVDIDIVLDDSPSYARVRLPVDTEVSAMARRHPLFSRHTNRLAFRRDALPGDVLGRVGAMSENAASVAVITEPETVAGLARWVAVASQARFRTREIHAWFARTLRFTAEEVERGDGLDVATFDLPPGGRGLLHLIRDWKRLQLLNRLGMHRVLSGIEAGTVNKTPALIAILGDEGPAATLDAGRLLERAWIELNRSGIAVQPFYVIPDQLQRLREGSVPGDILGSVRAMAEALPEILGQGEFHMMLRIGFPDRAPVVARRVSRDRVFRSTEGGRPER